MKLKQREEPYIMCCSHLCRKKVCMGVIFACTISERNDEKLGDQHWGMRQDPPLSYLIFLTIYTCYFQWKSATSLNTTWGK